MEDYRLDAIKQSLRRICAEGEAALEAQSVDIILGIGDAARDEESGLLPHLSLSAQSLLLKDWQTDQVYKSSNA
jgi:hypothetical protein